MVEFALLMGKIYVETATFIPITFMVAFCAVLLGIKIVGPLQPIPENKTHFSPASGEAYSSFLMGLYVLMLVIINLVSFTAKPYYTPTYIIDSNRLFMTIMTLILAIWFMMEIFIAPSPIQLIMYLGSGAVLFVLWFLLAAGVFTGGPDSIEIMDFMEYSFVLMILVGVITWPILQWLMKKYAASKNRGKWALVQPLYIMPKKAQTFLRAAKYEWLKLLVLFVLFLLSWADIPIF